MNQKKLLNLVERLRKAGQVTRNTLLRFNYGASPWDHNAQVDAAAKALAAEIEALESVYANRGTAPYPTQAEVDDELNDFRTGSRR